MNAGNKQDKHKEERELVQQICHENKGPDRQSGS